eukprot:5107694-Heterocapsa_arctica.AAC.1
MWRARANGRPAGTTPPSHLDPVKQVRQSVYAWLPCFARRARRMRYFGDPSCADLQRGGGPRLR